MATYSNWQQRQLDIESGETMDRAKRKLEDGDRTRMLVIAARNILGDLDHDWRESWQTTARILHERGPFSIPDAMQILEFIDWEDSRQSRIERITDDIVACIQTYRAAPEGGIVRRATMAALKRKMAELEEVRNGSTRELANALRR